MELKFSKRRPVGIIGKINFMQILNDFDDFELLAYKNKFHYINGVLSVIQEDYDEFYSSIDSIIKQEYDFAKLEPENFFNTDYTSIPFKDIEELYYDGTAIIKILENERPFDGAITKRIKKHIFDILNYKHLEVYNMTLYDLDITEQDLKNNLDLQVAYDNYVGYQEEAHKIYEKLKK